eukprot:2457417-Rhodomonas_salina.2
MPEMTWDTRGEQGQGLAEGESLRGGKGPRVRELMREGLFYLALLKQALGVEVRELGSEGVGEALCAEPAALPTGDLRLELSRVGA